MNPLIHEMTVNNLILQELECFEKAVEQGYALAAYNLENFMKRDWRQAG